MADEELDISEIPAIADRKGKESGQIPGPVVQRLPHYFRCLRELLNNDTVKVSSAELSALMGISAPQLRQDLKYFGGIGHRGYGYNVKKLYTQISEALGVGKKYTAVILGAGDLCRALYKSRIFEQRGVWIKGIFDCSMDVIGTKISDMTVSDASGMSKYCQECGIDILVVCCTPADVDRLYTAIRDCRVGGVWNFSSHELDERLTRIPVMNICTGDSLMLLMRKMASDQKISDKTV